MLAIACVLSAAFQTEAQDTNCIKIRVLDSKSGKPIHGVEVSVWMRASSWIDDDTRSKKTDAQGVARFCSTDPNVSLFTLRLKYLDWTEPQMGFNMELALKSGIVTKNNDKNRRARDGVSPEPGEIIVFGRRWSLLDKLLYKLFPEFP